MHGQPNIRRKKHFPTCIVHSTNFPVISVTNTAYLAYHLLIDLENGFFRIEFHVKLSYNALQVIVMVTCEFWPNDLNFDSAAPSESDCEAAASTCQPNSAHWHTQWTCSVSFLCQSPYHKIMKFIAKCGS
jgi:hypothetical protein